MVGGRMIVRFIIIAFLSISTLYAHKINLFAYDEEGSLYVQSYFTKSAPCKQCTILLQDFQDKELARFQTDDEGKASIKLPAPHFKITVEGGMGHQATLDYEAKSHTKEELKTLPSDTPLSKVALGLAIIVFFFGALFWIKRPTRR